MQATNTLQSKVCNIQNVAWIMKNTRMFKKDKKKYILAATDWLFYRSEE